MIAKRLHARQAAFRRGLEIDLRRAPAQRERLLRRRHGDAKGGAGEVLAVGAVTDRHARGVDVGFVLDRPAVALAVDLHRILQHARMARLRAGELRDARANR